MFYLSIVVLTVVLVVVFKSWFEDLHMNSFENKINKEIDELKGDEEDE